MYACLFIPEISPDGRAKLLACAAAFSPLFETGDSYAILDLRGLASLFGKPEQIAAQLAKKAAQEKCLVNVAVASNPHTALMAAQGCPGKTVISPGSEAQAIAHLPLSLLRPDEEIKDTLSSWGIQTLGQLASLPAAGIAERLGPEGVRLRQLARGCHSRTLVPDSAEKRYVAELNFEHGIDSLEPLAFVLSRLLHEICGQLQADSLATNEIRLQLTLEDREIFERVLRLPFASCDPATFLRLLQHNLATHSPDAEIYGVNLTATPVHPRLVQQGLFLPAAPQPEKLELTLARVTAIVGQGNVGSPEILDTHRPGAFRMEPFNVNSASKPGRYEKPDNNKQIVLAIRLFRPPLPAEVTLARGRPIRIRSRVAAGVVTAYAGPWRISGDWWTPATWARDEWDVQIDSGALFRIYNEGLKGWYVEGSYD